MALTFGAAVLTGGMTLQDYNGDSVPMQLYLTAATAAAGQTALEGLATAYADGVGGATISKLRVSQTSDDIGDDGNAPTNPVPAFGHQGQYVARFVFNKVGGGVYSLDVPAPIEGVLLAGDKKIIDSGNAKVAAFVAACIASLAAPDGAALDSLKEAYVKHHESKKG